MKQAVNFFKKLSLIQRILIGIVVGLILGLTVPKASGITLLGTMFVGALKAVAPLLVFVLILASLAKHQEGTQTYVKKIIGVYLFVTFIGSLVAVIMSFIFPIQLTLQGVSNKASAPQGIGEVLQNILLNIVQNPVQALMEGNYLGILFWAALLGFALRKASPNTKVLFDEVADGVTKVVQMVIAFAPLGIAGLVFNSVSEAGIKGLQQYGSLLLLLVGTMALVALVFYPLVVFFFIRENPYPLVLYTLKESGIPAFFTRSSAANIPINMMLAEKMGLNEQSYSVSLPLGSTINMGGAAVTISIMTLAAVHTTGIEVHPFIAFVLCVLSALSACGASGIAGGSLLLIPLACSLFGISNDIAMQVVGVGFIIGVIQDSVETALNSSADLLFTATVELGDKRKHGEKLNLKTRLAN